jgi:uncharacterized protein (DUF2235 family)
MGKNILIFADGTGQAGGLAPDQRLSNIYKLYRACRSGPDSSIDQRFQVAYYDAGLGTDQDGGRLGPNIVKKALKLWSSTTGRGISRNITDCYEAILRHYEHGDRIYLFGFSRGAYTARCLGGVLMYCGVPTQAADGSPVPRRGYRARRIAREAVRDVYEHGAGRDRATYEPERDEMARRFRAKYKCDDNGKSNVVPYFIGVFDTVAALGAAGPARWALMLLGFGAIASLSALASYGLAALFGLNFASAFAGLFVASSIVSTVWMLRASLHVIQDFPAKGQTKRHLARWRSGMYDRLLSKRVNYGRHALSIDERRESFARVPWGLRGTPPDRPGGIDWLRQVWFAGDHSDVGGSYAEDESRLSDVSLQWMIEQVRETPFPMLVDDTRLKLYPDTLGMQHDQVEEWSDRFRWLPTWLRPRWSIKTRVEVEGSVLHPSVHKRLDEYAVLQHSVMRPYRPEGLRADTRLAKYFEGPEDTVG